MKIKVGESAGSGANDVLATGCKTDFSDLRFTAADGTTLLDYWIESVSGTTPNQVATIWIEFDSIGTGATTFYMYYGNSAASAVSSGASTFMAFDDIERGNNGDAIGGSWTVTAGASTISTTQKYGGTRSQSQGANSETRFPVTNSASIAIRWRCWKGNAATWQLIHGNGTKNAYVYLDNVENIQTYDGSLHDTGVNISADTWALLEVRNCNFSAGTFDLYHNDTLAVAGAAMWANGSYSNIFRSSSSDAVSYTDDLLVRQFLATEPAWGAWGGAENISGPGTATGLICFPQTEQPYLEKNRIVGY